MGLLQVEATAEVLAALREIPDLYLIRSEATDLGAGRYRVAGYGDEALVPELEARGCRVEVLMNTAELEAYHDRVAEDIQNPEERAADRRRRAAVRRAKPEG